MEIPSYVLETLRGYADGLESAYTLGLEAGRWLQVAQKQDLDAYHTACQMASRIDEALRTETQDQARQNIRKLLGESNA